MIDRLIAWLRSWFTETKKAVDRAVSKPVAAKRYPDLNVVCTACPHPRRLHKNYGCRSKSMDCECKGFTLRGSYTPPTLAREIKALTQCSTAECDEKRSLGSNLCKDHRFERLVVQRQRWGQPLIITASAAD